MEYKNDYERFKFKMTVISMVFTILNLCIFNYRYLDIAWLVAYRKTSNSKAIVVRHFDIANIIKSANYWNSTAYFVL